MPTRESATCTNAQNGSSINDYVSQRLERKRIRMTQTESLGEDVSSELESESDAPGDAPGDVPGDAFAAPARAGIIEHLSLKNFMCHDSFELALGPQLNFIIGRNGSGKSAILTGISVGLGAKAADTSRGSLVKALIKDGRLTARVTITLRNEGPEAFEPAVYGPRIVVERKFQRGGANAYYIRAHDGTTVSTKKATLDDILYKFNITVDNPLAFLSQDRAREFLTATTDHIKYDYFMAGALINDILENYKHALQNIVAIEGRLAVVRTELAAAQHQYDELKRLYDKFRRSDSLRRQLDLINAKMYWFNVRIIEAKVAKYRDDIGRLEEELILLEDEVEQIDKFLGAFDAHKAQVEAQAVAADGAAEAQKAVAAAATAEVKRIQTAIDDFGAEIQDYRAEIKESEGEITQMRHKLRREQEKVDEATGGSKAKLAQSLERLRHELRQTEAAKQATVAQLTARHDDGVAAAQQAADASTEVLNALRERRRNTLEAQRDKYTPWGREISAVLQEIERVQQWHRPPVGPMGAYIEVKAEYEAWKDLLNASFGKTLDSFLVHDDHDRRLLEGILRRQRVNKNIVTRQFERFEYANGVARCACPTVMDLLTVHDDNVLYTLIDTNNIERNVLATRSEVSAALSAGVLNAFLLLNHKSGQRTSGDANTFRIDPIYYRLREAHKFATARHDGLDKLEADIERESAANSDLVRELRRLTMARQNEVRRLERAREELDVTMRRLGNEVFEIENRLTENGDVSVIEALKQGISELEAQVRQRRGFIELLEEDMAKEREALQQRRVVSELERAALARLEESLRAARTRLTDVEAEFHVKTNERAHLEQTRAKRQQALEALRLKLARGEAALAEHTREALDKCPRDEVVLHDDDTVELITEEYRLAQEAVRELERSIGRSYEEIQHELLAHKAAKERYEHTESDLSTTARELDDILNQRLKYLQTTILKTIREASSSFERLLALRGFTGELKFGFKEKTLTMLVQTNEARGGGKRTVESLLGGEKLFAQIALLLAIWKAMNSKIRGLDEFDVFMDLVNRSISIKLLLTELRKYPKLQSIFITPQDIAIVGELDSADVKIHKMDDPRGQ